GDVLAPRHVRRTRVERSADKVGDRVTVRSWGGGADPTTDAPPGHAVQAHQATHTFLVDDNAAVAELTMHPRDPVVAVRGIEDLTHQRHQRFLGDLTLGWWRRLPGAPVIEP